MQVSHFVKVVLATISLFILLFEFTVFICNTNVVKKDFLKKLFLLFFFVFCAFISNDYFILMLVLFALCATKKINIDTLLKITMFCLISIINIIKIIYLEIFTSLFNNGSAVSIFIREYSCYTIIKNFIKLLCANRYFRLKFTWVLHKIIV